MSKHNEHRSFMERLVDLWENCGRYLGHRPAQIIGIILGGAILIGLLGYSSVTATSNTTHIENIQNAFCNGNLTDTVEQQRNCRQLLDRLLKDPTPEQAKRLRELVKEGR